MYFLILRDFIHPGKAASDLVVVMTGDVSKVRSVIENPAASGLKPGPVAKLLLCILDSDRVYRQGEHVSEWDDFDSCLGLAPICISTFVGGIQETKWRDPKAEREFNSLQ